MREPSLSRHGASPQNGDVMVACESRSGVHYGVHYTVRQLPGIVRFSSTVRDEAVRLARSLAQRYVVDVWYSEAETYRLLEAYRPRTSARDRPPAGKVLSAD